MTTSGTASPAVQDLEAAVGAAGDRDWLLTAGGATLLLLALSKRSTIGVAALLGGGYLLYRSLPSGTISNRLPASLGAVRGSLGAIRDRVSSSFDSESRRDGQDWYPPEDADFVDEASMDSFPASDPATKF